MTLEVVSDPLNGLIIARLIVPSTSFSKTVPRDVCDSFGILTVAGGYTSWHLRLIYI